MGYRGGGGDYPTLDRRRAGCGGGDLGRQRRSGNAHQRRRDQPLVHAGPRRNRWALGVQRRRAWRGHGCCDRRLAGARRGVGEITGYSRSLDYRPLEARWFYGVYASGVVAAAALVWAVGNLVWLNIAAQVLNAFLMPLAIGFLVILAIRALPEPLRLKGGRLWVLIGISGVVSTLAIVGGISGMR